MSLFELDHRLAADSVFVVDGPLSQLRLMDDARFPWLVLVPRVADTDEWIDLDEDSQQLLLAEIRNAGNLLAEIRNAGNLLRACAPCDKLNIGALGNIVRQLHVHVVARTDSDAAWPGPVWGAGSRERFRPQSLERQLERLRSSLQPGFWLPA